MRKLIRGIREFQTDIFQPMRDFFEALAEGQSPRALFISCSDSRVSADLITQAEPGDLFVLRNAGNLVPPYGATNGGEEATIEYAVAQLKIRNIIVCGHAGCGAMNALAHPESLKDLPAVSRWLRHAEATRLIARELPDFLSEKQRIDEIAKANVLVQLENLRSHPCVAASLRRGSLNLHGWFYEFTTGEVHTYDPREHCYRPVSLFDPVCVVPPGIPACELPSRPGHPGGAWIVEASQPRFDRTDSCSSELPAPRKVSFSNPVSNVDGAP